MGLYNLFKHTIEDPLLGNNDDDDVSFAKRLLGIFDYREPEAAPSCFADRKFLDDIREFQKDNDLKVDGVITPGGETERTISERLTEKVRVLSEEDDESEEKKEVLEWQDIDDSWGPTEWEKRCAYHLNYVDGPTCKRLEKTRRRQGRYKHRPEGSASERCWASANERYAYCLKHETLSGLPPLDAWDH